MRTSIFSNRVSIIVTSVLLAASLQACKKKQDAQLSPKAKQTQASALDGPSDPFAVTNLQLNGASFAVGASIHVKFDASGPIPNGVYMYVRKNAVDHEDVPYSVCMKDGGYYQPVSYANPGNYEFDYIPYLCKDFEREQGIPGPNTGFVSEGEYELVVEWYDSISGSNTVSGRFQIGSGGGGTGTGVSTGVDTGVGTGAGTGAGTGVSTGIGVGSTIVVSNVPAEILSGDDGHGALEVQVDLSKVPAGDKFVRIQTARPEISANVNSPGCSPVSLVDVDWSAGSTISNMNARFALPADGKLKISKWMLDNKTQNLASVASLALHFSLETSNTSLPGAACSGVIRVLPRVKVEATEFDATACTQSKAGNLGFVGGLCIVKKGQSLIHGAEGMRIRTKRDGARCPLFMRPGSTTSGAGISGHAMSLLPILASQTEIGLAVGQSGAKKSAVAGRTGQIDLTTSISTDDAYIDSLGLSCTGCDYPIEQKVADRWVGVGSVRSPICGGQEKILPAQGQDLKLVPTTGKDIPSEVYTGENYDAGVEIGVKNSQNLLVSGADGETAIVRLRPTKFIANAADQTSPISSGLGNLILGTLLDLSPISSSLQGTEVCNLEGETKGASVDVYVKNGTTYSKANSLTVSKSKITIDRLVLKKISATGEDVNQIRRVGVEVVIPSKSIRYCKVVSIHPKPSVSAKYVNPGTIACQGKYLARLGGNGKQGTTPCLVSEVQLTVRGNTSPSFKISKIVYNNVTPDVSVWVGGKDASSNLFKLAKVPAVSNPDPNPVTGEAIGKANVFSSSYDGLGSSCRTWRYELYQRMRGVDVLLQTLSIPICGKDASPPVVPNDSASIDRDTMALPY